MSKLTATLQDLPNIVKYGLVIGAVIFISTLFPSNNRFPFTYEEGKNWDHENLFAPIDFVVKKSDAEINTEKAKIEKQFAAIYNFNNRIIEDRKNAFKGAFDQKIDLSKATFLDVASNSEKYINAGFEVIDQIYEKGIIERSPQNQSFEEGDEVNVLRGLSVKKRTIQSFYNPTQASEKAIDLVFQRRMLEGDFLVSIFDAKFFRPNIILQDSITKQYQQTQFDKIVLTKDSILTNQLIISKGDEIGTEDFEKIAALEAEYSSDGKLGKFSWSVFLGYLLLTSLVIGVLLFYLQYDAVKIFEKYSSLIFILLWVVIYSYLVSAVEKAPNLNSYMIPFCIAPIVLKTFYDQRVALFTHIVIILLASFLSSEGYEFTFLQLLVGIVAVLIPIEARDWTKFFYFLAIILGTYVLGFFGLSLISKTGFQGMNWSTYGWIFMSVFLTLLAYPLIPLFERIFGFTSPISLMELSDINKPLLKDLAEHAPGTFQHSLQVGNLAAAAANGIEADSLLVKVGALYHDIGKIKKPEYYIENQSRKNPHDDLDPIESAKIILEHVTEGEKIAKENRLPTSIIGLIKSHHGKTRVEYFYKKYKNLNPTQKISEKDFMYSGPLPKTKEETILMLADSIEAAAKTLNVKNEDAFQNLVTNIISNKINQGQLNQSDLSFEELEICKSAFVKTLKSIYHGRTKY